MRLQELINPIILKESGKIDKYLEIKVEFGNNSDK